jgi:hypothetical protein
VLIAATLQVPLQCFFLGLCDLPENSPSGTILESQHLLTILGQIQNPVDRQMLIKIAEDLSSR